MAAPGAAPVPVPVPPPVGSTRSRIEVAHIENDSDPVPVGAAATVRVVLANTGPDQSAAPFTVQMTLPDGATAVGPYFPTVCTADVSATTVTCVFPPGLRVLRSATVLVPIQISPSARSNGNLTGGVVTVTNGNNPDPNGAVHSVNFDIRTA